MTLLKQILETTKAGIAENGGATNGAIAATHQNKHQSSFSLLQNIHGSELTSTDVSSHLQHVDTSDEEVDTVAFGLETTDGKIVKVYVNAEEADAFEERMSQLLGKIDDIDQALEELSNDFDIVNVVKPDDLEADAASSSLDGETVDGNLENRLDEPLTDDDLVQDLDSEDLVDDDSDKDKKKKPKKAKEDPDSKEDKDEDEDKASDDKEENVDDLDVAAAFDSAEDSEDKDSEDKDSEEDEGEDEDSTEDEDADEDAEEDKDEDEDSKKDKKKKPKKAKDEVKQENIQNHLSLFASLTEAHHFSNKKQKDKKPEQQDQNIDDTADIYDLNLSKDEDELDKLFTLPTQHLIFRTLLLLGVNAEQMNVRKFKVRKGIKDIAIIIQHHPQIKNALSKLGRDLASKKSEIHAINEGTEKADGKAVDGTIKDQLSTEISKKIYDVILSLGLPEFLLTYKRTAFRKRIQNVAKLAVKHSRIKNYIYVLSDLLKSYHKSGSLNEMWEQEVELIKIEVERDSGLFEQIAKSAKFADLGTVSVVSMGKLGGTEIKVKDFTLELSETEFETFVEILHDGEGGIVSSNNIGKINIIPTSTRREFILRKVKPSKSDKYPHGVLITKKSFAKIVG